MSRTLTVPLDASLLIGGTEQTITFHVTGTYHAAQPAYTPRGEMAPIDPPEPSSFEPSKIEVYNMARAELLLWPLPLTDDQWSELADMALMEIESGDGPEWYGRDPDAEAELRRENVRNDFEKPLE